MNIQKTDVEILHDAYRHLWQQIQHKFLLQRLLHFATRLPFLYERRDALAEAEYDNTIIVTFSSLPSSRDAEDSMETILDHAEKKKLRSPLRINGEDFL